MKTPAHDTALFLAAQEGFGALGGTSGWPVYVGREPLQPVDVVTVYDTGGLPDPLVDNIEEPTIQVRVRCDSYIDGWAKADEARRDLQSEIGYPVAGGQVVQWIAQGGVTYIGRDDNERALFTCNFRVMREYE